MAIIKSEFQLALNQVAAERGISVDEVVLSVESAILAAYRKENPGKEIDDTYSVKINLATGEAKILKDNRDITPSGFGRIAAQTAKQVILQKIRMAERKNVVEHYQSKIGTTVRGKIVRYDGRNVYLDVNKTEVVLPFEEQIKNERYQTGGSILIYIKDIVDNKLGSPRIIVSRTAPEIIEELFKREVPEVANKAVKIQKVVRSPGERAKIAVSSNHKGVDPVGSCVGQKGIRVQMVTNELGGKEKIDIIQWSPDNKVFIAAALAPAEIKKITINESNKTATIIVTQDQAPLAIGAGGVNINLASELTGFRLTIEQIPEDKPQKDKA